MAMEIAAPPTPLKSHAEKVQEAAKLYADTYTRKCRLETQIEHAVEDLDNKRKELQMERTALKACKEALAELTKD